MLVSPYLFILFEILLEIVFYVKLTYVTAWMFILIDFAHDYYVKWKILLYWFSIQHSLYCVPEINPPVKLCAIISPYLCFAQFWGLKAIYEKLQSEDSVRIEAKEYGLTIHGFISCYSEKHLPSIVAQCSLSVLEETLLHFVLSSNNGEIKKII